VTKSAARDIIRDLLLIRSPTRAVSQKKAPMPDWFGARRRKTYALLTASSLINGHRSRPSTPGCISEATNFISYRRRVEL
jgi:hypothetical protein